MAHSVCQRRLQIELVELRRNPVQHVKALPNEKNILEWHYVVEGPPGTPYEGGVYHGLLRFPKEYPYKPPSIFMITRNGRFMVNTRLCLSMSDFHPEQWNPMWCVSSILSGLLSFMLDNENTYGSLDSTDAQKRAFAANSMAENARDKSFVALFPEYVEQYEAKMKERMAEKARQKKASSESAANEAQGMSRQKQTGPKARFLGFENSFISFGGIVLAVTLVLLLILFAKYSP